MEPSPVRTFLPVVLLTVGATVLAGVVSGVVGAMYEVAAGDTGATATVANVLVGLATAVGTAVGSILSWRRGADAVTAVAIGAGAALTTQIVFTMLARLGGASVGGGTVLASMLGALVGAGGAWRILSRRLD